MLYFLFRGTVGQEPVFVEGVARVPSSDAIRARARAGDSYTLGWE